MQYFLMMCDFRYEMMKNCWKFNPKERPTFEQLEYFFDQQEQKLTNCII